MRPSPEVPTPTDQLEIRAIEPGDKADLEAAIAQSSDEAIYRRRYRGGKR